MAIDAINIARLQNLNLDDPSNPAPLKAYLMDPIFCESFKRFCVKSFCVESVLFYLVHELLLFFCFLNVRIMVALCFQGRTGLHLPGGAAIVE